MSEAWDAGGNYRDAIKEAEERGRREALEELKEQLPKCDDLGDVWTWVQRAERSDGGGDGE